MRPRLSASPPGQPPSAHVPNGLREVNFDVRGFIAIIGPRKFQGSRFFDRPVPNIHEFGGIAVTVLAFFGRRYAALYPERSFMWAAVISLQRKNKIAPTFTITLARSW